MRNGLVFYTPNQYQTIPIIREIFYSRVYGDLSGLPDDALIIDVGGYIGTFALMIARQYPHAKIHTFEPEQSNYEYLLKNVKANKCTNIIYHNEAVGAKSGVATLYVRGPGAGTNSIHKAKGGQPVAVNVITLADFLTQEEISKVDLLKLDCEGSEPEIMETLPSSVNFVVLEWPKKLPRREFSVRHRYAEKA